MQKDKMYGKKRQNPRRIQPKFCVFQLNLRPPDRFEKTNIVSNRLAMYDVSIIYSVLKFLYTPLAVLRDCCCCCCCSTRPLLETVHAFCQNCVTNSMVLRAYIVLCARPYNVSLLVSVCCDVRALTCACCVLAFCVCACCVVLACCVCVLCCACVLCVRVVLQCLRSVCVCVLACMSLCIKTNIIYNSIPPSSSAGRHELFKR